MDEYLLYYTFNAVIYAFFIYKFQNENNALFRLFPHFATTFRRLLHIFISSSSVI